MGVGLGVGGDAPWALAIMWVLVAMVFILLLLRLYTRMVCVAAYGIDDHIYMVAFVSITLSREPFNLVKKLTHISYLGVDIPPSLHDFYPSRSLLWLRTNAGGDRRP